MQSLAMKIFIVGYFPCFLCKEIKEIENGGGHQTGSVSRGPKREIDI